MTRQLDHKCDAMRSPWYDPAASPASHLSGLPTTAHGNAKDDNVCKVVKALSCFVRGWWIIYDQPWSVAKHQELIKLALSSADGIFNLPGYHDGYESVQLKMNLPPVRPNTSHDRPSPFFRDDVLPLIWRPDWPFNIAESLRWTVFPIFEYLRSQRRDDRVWLMPWLNGIEPSAFMRGMLEPLVRHPLTGSFELGEPLCTTRSLVCDLGMIFNFIQGAGKALIPLVDHELRFYNAHCDKAKLLSQRNIQRINDSGPEGASAGNCSPPRPAEQLRLDCNMEHGCGL